MDITTGVDYAKHGEKIALCCNSKCCTNIFSLFHKLTPFFPIIFATAKGLYIVNGLMTDLYRG